MCPIGQQAEVLLGVGADGQPGIAGVDDNVNEVIDDRSEMGAVGSDDECLAPADVGYSDMKAHPNSLVISRGTFVPCEESGSASRYLTPEGGWVIRE